MSVKHAWSGIDKRCEIIMCMFSGSKVHMGRLSDNTQERKYKSHMAFFSIMTLYFTCHVKCYGA